MVDSGAARSVSHSGVVRLNGPDSSIHVSRHSESCGRILDHRTRGVRHGTWALAVRRAWAREQDGIGKSMQNFCLDDATCFDEKDRPVIYHNISAFMKDLNFVQLDATIAEACTAFIARCIYRAVFGSRHVRYPGALDVPLCLK